MAMLDGRTRAYPRSIQLLVLAGETPETLRAALAAHVATAADFAGSEGAAQDWLDRRYCLLQELAMLERNHL